MLRQEKLLCICVGFLLCSKVVSQVTLGSKISVEERNSWVSPNGDFAIGFFSRLNQYSVGIRFNSDSIRDDEKMVVWVAGADLLVGNMSYFQLTENGALILFDSTKGRVAWTSKTTESSVASGALLDCGNLVLRNKKNKIVWESFDTPSDTLLPGQNLSVTQTLRASIRSPLSSYYSLYLNVSGQLQLRWESDVVFWTGGVPDHSVTRAMLSSDGTLQLFDQESKPIWSVFGDDHNDSDVKFRFLRLDVDGNLRLYSWIQTSKSWSRVWQAIGNQCNVFATCGLYGVCAYNASGSAVCKCPFSSPVEPNSKCLVPYGPECKSGSFVTAYYNTFLYGIYPPNETITKTSLQQCRSLCQNDPVCTAVTFTNDGSADCRMMKTRYISGRSDPSISSLSFVKKCSDPVAILPLSPPSSPLSSSNNNLEKRSNRLFILVVGGSTLLVFIVIQFGVGFCVYKKRRSMTKADSAYTGSGPKVLTMLSYNEIRDLTENFKNQIGPRMFKGVFQNGQPVVVKDLNAITEEKKFRDVVSKTGNIFHKNLVTLEGYCRDPGHRFLVYEFVKHGSLRQCIDDPKISKRLTWKKRMGILVAVARAVSYLHNECREFVSHGNLKCDNVVLDENLEAKVSEFGLSGRGEGEAEIDVGDFGKMVLELISGCQDDVCQLAYGKWTEGQARDLVDEKLIEGGDLNLDELERALRIAFWCLQADERMRPPMTEVVKVLEGILSVDPPPPPFVSRRYLEVQSPGTSSGSE